MGSLSVKTEQLVEVLNKAVQDHPVSPKTWSQPFEAGGVSVYTFVGFDWVRARGQMVVTVQLLVAQGVGVECRRVLCLLRDEKKCFIGGWKDFRSGEVEFRVPPGKYHLEFYYDQWTLAAA